MTDHIILQVTRYRPERELEPTTQEYKIPLQLDNLDSTNDMILEFQSNDMFGDFN